MKRVLVVTGSGAGPLNAAEASRIRQIASFLTATGCIYDILCIAEHGLGDGAPFIPPGAQGIAFAHISADDAKRQDFAGALEILALGMSPTKTYDLILQCGVALHRAVLPRVPRVFDALNGDVRSWPDAETDLFLAADEQTRQAGAANADVAVRWPLALPEAIHPKPKGTQLGWPGAFDHHLAGLWENLLARLTERRIELPSGVCVPRSVRIPEAMRGTAADTSAYSEAAQVRALGLCVLPGGRPAEHLCQTVHLIAQGTPVITTPAIAVRFEDRWKLPVSDSIDGMLDWIHGWADGRDREVLAEATRETAKAFAKDVANMTDYVAEQFQEILTRRPETAPAEPL